MSIEVSLFIILFLFSNIIAFVLMFFDKKISKKRDNNKRISEGVLFFMATFLGSAGILLGMFVFRHKVKKWYFVISIPFLILQNISFLYFIHQFIVLLRK